MDNPPLRTFVRDPKPGEVGYDPWAFVHESPGTVVESFYGNKNVMSRLITVSLFQSPTPIGATPNRMQLTAVWNLVCDAANHVDEDAATNVFIELQRQVEQAPMQDPQTKGLVGAVRFRLLYFRG